MFAFVRRPVGFVRLQNTRRVTQRCCAFRNYSARFPVQCQETKPTTATPLEKMSFNLWCKQNDSNVHDTMSLLKLQQPSQSLVHSRRTDEGLKLTDDATPRPVFSCVKSTSCVFVFGCLNSAFRIIFGRRNVFVCTVLTNERYDRSINRRKLATAQSALRQ